MLGYITKPFFEVNITECKKETFFKYHQNNQIQHTRVLGKKAENAEYMNKFKGTGADKPVPVKKTMLEAADADAVTGATITFTGVSKALEYGSEFAKKLGGQK